MSTSRDKLLVALVFIAVASVFVLTILNSVFLTVDSKDWQSTQAMVIERTRRQKSAELRYKYTVDDKEFIGDTVAPLYDGEHHDKDWINQRYQVGSAIEIYFNPDNPSQSVMDRQPLDFTDILLYLAMVGAFYCAAGSACDRAGG